MRVLHLDSATEHRGGQTQLAYLVEGSNDAVMCPRGAAIRAHIPDAIPYGPMSLVRAIRHHRPDVLAAHTSRAHGLAVLQRRVPVVVHRRLDFPPGRFSRAKYAAARGFVAVSHAVEGVLVGAGVPRDRIRVVHDGVRVREGRALPRPQGLLVVAVGALVDHKDHLTLVRAAHLGGFTTWIAGEGPLRGVLEAEIARLDAPVTLLGQRGDVADLLATADVFCHPSREEGLGQVVIEARALGCRVVATRAGGVPEVAGPHAHLVPPGSPAALAEAISGAAHQPRPAGELPTALSASTLRERTFAAYRSLLGI